MSLSSWWLYAGIVFGAALCGLMLGQFLQWKSFGRLIVPISPLTPRNKRLTAMALALLAILTVMSSTLTSNELRSVQERRVELDERRSECLVALTETIVDRARISDEDHRNTTVFILELEETLLDLPEMNGGEQVLIQAAARYRAEQKRLQQERVNSRFNSESCR